MKTSIPGRFVLLAVGLVLALTNPAVSDESLVKWEQPPQAVTTTNLFYGWNEKSVYDGWQIAADDWVCMTSDPVTDIRWWGSFLNWSEATPPPMPDAFHIGIWTDVPVGGQNNYSHPGVLVWEVLCTNFAWQFVGWDYDPRTQTYEACYRFDQRLLPPEWFYQDPELGGTRIYWVSIAAVYQLSPPIHPWGWKTRPRDPSSPAPDDAVRIFNPTAPQVGMQFVTGQPIWWPTPDQSWDLAFELWSNTDMPPFAPKWRQPPVLYQPENAFNGWNEVSQFAGTQIVADDWVCTNTWPVTDLHWWGSYLGWSETVPPQVPDAFQIAFWSDVPRGISGYSHPGEVLWSFFCTNFSWQFAGWDIDPRNPNRPPEACFRFDQELMESEWFHQNPTGGTNIYWVSIAAVYRNPPQEYLWGWTTRPRDPASPAPDDAVLIYQPTTPMPGMLFSRGEPIEYPPSVSWDTAFVLTTRRPEVMLDFGDAPDPTFPTLLAGDGARHVIVPGFYLGGTVDAEPDGQPDATATGDDNNGVVNDEDGVAFTSILLPGSPASVEVTASAAGQLDAWIDFTADGDWDDPGEQIFANQSLTAGLNSLGFTVPTNAAGGMSTFARFRFSSAGGLPYKGLASDGEVEDHMVTINQWEKPQADLGDAPDSSNSWGPLMTAYPPGGGPPGVIAQYPTVFQAGSPPFGPLHSAPLAWAWLGPAVSLELEADLGPDQDGVNNLLPPINVPDLDGFDDSVQFPLSLPHCRPTTFTFLLNAPVGGPVMPMFVNVWFDWNRDGDWNDILACPDGALVPEWAVQNFPVPLAPGLNPVPTPPFKSWHPSTNIAPIWMRITLAEQPWPPPGAGLAGGDGPNPPYQFGETEDYYIRMYDLDQQLDFGDAPDPNYPTLLASDGARHGVIQGFQLGALIDAEPDGQPTANADGDDLNPPLGPDDEDGVTFITSLVISTQACVDITLTAGPAGGLLDTWVDFDRDGSWEPGEQVFGNLSLSPGANTNLCFNVPLGAVPGPTFARFRLSSAGNLSPTGGAQDGEVEDYALTIHQFGPAADLVITQLVQVATGSVLRFRWRSETNVIYQAQETDIPLHATNLTWQNLGGYVTGPANEQTDTNAVKTQKTYRVVVPYAPPPP